MIVDLRSEPRLQRSFDTGYKLVHITFGNHEDNNACHRKDKNHLLEKAFVGFQESL